MFDHSPPIFLAAALAAVSLLFFLFGLTLIMRRARVQRTVRMIEGSGRWANQQDDGKGARGNPLKQLDVALLDKPFGRMLAAELERAGFARAPARFLMAAVVLGVVASIAGAYATPASAGSARSAAALCCFVFGAAGAFGIVRMRQGMRLAAFEKQLPDAVGTMAGALEVGATLPQAFEHIARETGQPTAGEFRRLNSELQLGVSLVEALQHLQSRLPSGDLALVTSAISIQQRLGGDLAGVLHNLSDTVRDRIRLRSEVSALTAQGRASGYLITAMPVAIFVLLWLTNYDYVAVLFEPGITRLLSIGALVGLVLGFFTIKRIVAVEV